MVVLVFVSIPPRRPLCAYARARLSGPARGGSPQLCIVKPDALFSVCRFGLQVVSYVMDGTCNKVDPKAEMAAKVAERDGKREIEEFRIRDAHLQKVEDARTLKDAYAYKASQEEGRSITSNVDKDLETGALTKQRSAAQAHVDDNWSAPVVRHQTSGYDGSGRFVVRDY